MRFRSLASLLALTLTGTPAMAADIYTVDKDHSQATFQVRHLLSKTGGRFSDFAGKVLLDEKRLEASSVEFRIRAASLDTDNEKRDQHLRAADFFDVEQHPEIVFKSEKIKKVGKDRYEVTGTFSMRGVDKRLVLPVAYLGAVKDPWGGQRAAFTTEVTLNRKEFGMVWNKALDNGGFVLGNDVWVTVELETVKQADAS